MKSPTKVLFASVGALATVIAFAGCSAGPSSASNEKVSITVASLIPGSSKEAFAAFDARVKAFEKVNPNITVKSEEYQWTGPTFSTQLAGGTLPDVFNVPFTDSKTLLQNGQLADISTEVKALPYADKFNKNVLSVAQDSSGKIYGLPYGPYAMGLSYNRAIFEKAGLDPNKPPTTWDEVRADAKIISEKVPGVAGYMQMTSKNTGGWILATTTYARGGRLETTNSSGKTTVKTDNAQTKAALQFLKDVRWTDNAAGSNFLLDWSGMNQAFGAGQVAMYPSGSDVLTSLVSTDGVSPKDYGLTSLPLTGSAAGVLSGGNVAAVSVKSTAAQKAAAVKWIDFYYIQQLVNKTQTVEAAKVLAASSQPVGVPTLPVFDQATYDQQQQWIKSEVNIPLSNVAPFTSKIFSQPIVPEPNKNTQELYGALDAVVQAVLTDKNADVDTLLKGVDTQIQALVDAGN
ncbi:MAG: multiple sugar transport system substrate-binding protein [Microbacteriaceae bacterium]|jgi:ABC-type glycerol-3-phosphate transport system substrate-binding protein|nr:extracellular solute-binding protein [Leifsonia sp.]MDQ1580133.1 multiple sugar transport system substrate-binding protein [Microbacteriaceae bacterium]MDQ1589014.1 multiple sugar transport system substrate-binding protein [Microbacteriaceae bacterium]